MEDNVEVGISSPEEDFYKKLLTSTLSESYTQNLQEKLLKSMERNEVLLYKKSRRKKSEEKHLLDVSEIEDSIGQLSMAIDMEQNAIKLIEKDEFFKSYRYSSFFYVDPIEESSIKKLQDNKEVYDFFAPDHSYDVSTEYEYEDQVMVEKPTLYSIGQVSIFKFSKVLTGFSLGVGEKKQIKYPILGIYFKNLGIFEVRLDSVRKMFRGNEQFYEHTIDSVLKWFRDNLKCKFTPVNFPPIIEHIRKNKSDEVAVHAQSMSFKNGSRATLENGINESYVLPLLGELQELIKENQALFDKSPEIKQLLETFISETETLANLPWVTLVWKNDKTRVKFKFGVSDQDFTILQYYGRQSEMEKMNYVTEYIIENKTEIDTIEKVRAGQVRTVSLDNQVI
ncbi:hypothetical protein [Paenibacillus sp. BIC5C1]|uniref:hypothetical protein n=1 Tax=Paenibacillus sp. BIC5C1 TaxID=3078263 RepID=UPI0028E6691B|nr:hypothetical protein [Paenibacillus sp. BIC5C1]